MTAEMSVCVCGTAAEVVAAKQFLLQSGYAATGITDEAVAVFNYDAETFGGGGNSDGLATKFVVIGRK
jgi:hypothetical protein